MTRVLCTTLLTDDARAFITGELGWSLEEVKQLSPDPDASVIIIEAEPLGVTELNGLPNLRLIVSVRGEPVNIDLPEVSRRNIPVVHAPGRNAEAVAEFTLGLVVSLIRHIAHTDHLVRSNVLTEVRAERTRRRDDVIWRPSAPDAPIPYAQFKGPGFRSVVLGLLGVGAIGRRVATMASTIGMTVIAYDPYIDECSGAQMVPFEELLRRCDVLSLHARGTGKPLIGKEELTQMQRGAMLVNTARAAILDYDALVEALRSGQIAAAALDVYPDEPLTPDDPLLGFENVILTPHIAGASTDVARQQWEILIAGLRALIVDETPENAPIRNREDLASIDLRDAL